MQDCSYAVTALDDAEQNINQEISSIIRRLESHTGRSEQLAEIRVFAECTKVSLTMPRPIYVSLLTVKVMTQNVWKS